MLLAIAVQLRSSLPDCYQPVLDGEAPTAHSTFTARLFGEIEREYSEKQGRHGRSRRGMQRGWMLGYVLSGSFFSIGLATAGFSLPAVLVFALTLLDFFDAKTCSASPNTFEALSVSTNADVGLHTRI